MTAALASASLVSFLLAPWAPVEGSHMLASVRLALLPMLEQFEGSVRYMYRDRKNRVATGIGTDINSSAAALSLEWRHSDGTPANSNEVVREWLRVRDLPANVNAGGGGGSVFATSAVLFVDEDSLREYTDDLLASYERVLRMPQHVGPTYDAIPGDAVCARLRTAYADGPYSLWPKMDAAIRAARFDVAADESKPHDYETQNDAYRRSYDAVKVMYENAAVVLQRGLDPTLVYWPRCLMEEMPA